MNTNEMLKLQAYVDGELTPREAGQIDEWLARDADAKALIGELKMTRGILSTNEPMATLPEAREFHWSKINREIERYESQPALVRQVSSPSWWLKYFSPLAVAAMLAAALILPGLNSNEADVQTESSPEASPVIFRSQAEGMTVIWLQSDENSEFAKPEGDF